MYKLIMVAYVFLKCSKFISDRIVKTCKFRKQIVTLFYTHYYINQIR